MFLLSAWHKQWVKFGVDRYKVILCVWTNPSFTGTTVGFKVASYSQAQEEYTSSVALKNRKIKKTPKVKNYWKR